jgi:hypothetical protein
MRVEPKVTFEQFRETYIAVLALKKKTSYGTRWWCVWIGIGLVMGLVPRMLFGRVAENTILCMLVFYWVIAKLLTSPLRDRRMRAYYIEEAANLNSQIFEIEESGLACAQADSRATSHYSWRAFIKRLDLPDAFVFLLSPNTFIRVPKETLSGSDRELIWSWSSHLPIGNTAGRSATILDNSRKD